MQSPSGTIQITLTITYYNGASRSVDVEPEKADAAVAAYMQNPSVSCITTEEILESMVA